MEQQKYYILKYSAMLYRQTQAYMGEQLRPYGIGAGQHSYLVCVANNPGLSLVELTQEAGVDACNTTRAVVKLESMGYVRVETDAQDKRVRRVYPTERTQEAVEAIRAARGAWRGIITQGMSEEEKRFTGDLLKRMSENAHACLRTIREGQS